MARGISVKTLLSKTFKTFEFDGIWNDVLGQQERNGIWVIYADEKNYKTSFTLMLSKYLTNFEKVNYISAEEGTGFTFQQTVARMNINFDNPRIKFYKFLEMDELEKVLKNREAGKVTVIDNATSYVDELKSADLRRLLKKYPKQLFIIIAHKEKNEPSTAMGKLAKKLSNVFINLSGSVAFFQGRCPGGELIIDKEKAMLYHGNKINK
ncbi:hypothetical protein [Flavobacterium columnare]|uniref:AAA+ ATPase domain-containing protein n=1 Tax=Flavobacterium columnare TaxID=996 RepID=A0AAI8CEX2_9FLAO|nr:hypothetical protein [Flavobacterium columnare]AMO19438.1 hypothetical protein UN65_02930 [Flavobacterium columnare]AUX17378.1 hypothetical protein AQ623_03015 [Flavobacterium columnare]QOG56402.1 hypothetical protein HUE29_02975 [Flavobacterium columnare]QOG59127.1 hypothetical protein HUE30_02980 [Flavobacterium columnare]QOG61847.1 hypothetical protein HUE31_02980 [Flavobacterium columnare]